VGSARGEDGRLLHCADCGEGFHPFCLPQSLPLATMDPITRLGWRCAMPRCLSLARACRCRPRSSALCIPVLPLRSLSCLSCLAVHVFVCVFVLFSPTTLFFCLLLQVRELQGVRSVPRRGPRQRLGRVGTRAPLLRALRPRLPPPVLGAHARRRPRRPLRLRPLRRLHRLPRAVRVRRRPQRPAPAANAHRRRPRGAASTPRGRQP
jgi:hypothetical protein